jgi:23S rRNA (cytosine1962-C5)-methyltransferase
MSLPQLTINPSAAKRLANFDCWVFRDELAGFPDGLNNGELVELVDRRSAFLGYAFYSTTSHIAVRVVSGDRNQPVDRALLAHRLTIAIQRREGICGTNAKRLIFSEADGLPGLIVDQYADFLVLQSRTAGIEAWKPVIVDLLQELVHPNGILERSDKEFREEEGLPPVTQVLAGTVPERLQIEECGLRFWVDPYHGQKTGFYLDQRQTRQRVRELIDPTARVADVCAYTGAFGIAAASRGARVVCVEQHEPFLELAKENARLNDTASHMDFVAGDAFYWLEAKANSRERFDWVCLDPPSLAKRKTEVFKGRRALHHLVVNALRILEDRGTLALSVCAYHLLGVVEEIVRIAAAECGTRLHVRDVILQAEDHPWLLQMPATRYLMSWLVQRDGRPAA